MDLKQLVTYSGLFQKEEEKLRTQLRRENQQRRMRERSNARGLTASYLEPDRYDDDEEGLEQSLLEMKKHYKKGLAKSRLGDVYSDQESEEEGISGGLESDDDSAENSADKGAGMSENDSTRQRKHSFEEPVVKKKRKKVIAESDEDESD
ncbi:RNA polymerase-associated LEO1 [Paramuricea clavata]|nr:RNA polymerase-associated LEO1 [Paramuricea clavata]